MAPIYREIRLDWKGKTYTLTPTYTTIQAVEQEVSLMALAQRITAKNPPYSQMADLLALTLALAGCRDEDATAEQINAEMYQGDKALKLLEAATRITFAMFPQKVLPGNEEAPEAGAQRCGTSTGQSTTESPLAASGSSQWSSGE